MPKQSLGKILVDNKRKIQHLQNNWILFHNKIFLENNIIRSLEKELHIEIQPYVNQLVNARVQVTTPLGQLQGMLFPLSHYQKQALSEYNHTQLDATISFVQPQNKHKLISTTTGRYVVTPDALGQVSSDLNEMYLWKVLHALRTGLTGNYKTIGTQSNFLREDFARYIITENGLYMKIAQPTKKSGLPSIVHAEYDPTTYWQFRNISIPSN